MKIIIYILIIVGIIFIGAYLIDEPKLGDLQISNDMTEGRKLVDEYRKTKSNDTMGLCLDLIDLGFGNQVLSVVTTTIEEIKKTKAPDCSKVFEDFFSQNKETFLIGKDIEKLSKEEQLKVIENKW